MTDLPQPEALLASARQLVADGQEDRARAVYLQLVSREPTHLEALHGLGALAYEGGYCSAARAIYQQIVSHHPQNVAGWINLGMISMEDEGLTAARTAFEAALTIEPCDTEAHRGLARVLEKQGDAEAADRHWRQSFPGQAIAVQRVCGNTAAIRVLLLVSVKGGNIPLKHVLNNRRFSVTALYVEYYDPQLPLPDHDVMFNAIGDADLCGAALEIAEEITAGTNAPVLNPPKRIKGTGREEIAARLGALKDVRAPKIRALNPDDKAADFSFPLLLRAPGFHTGQHFLKVEHREDLAAARSELPAGAPLAIEYLDARGPDGMARKYRVMVIGGKLYPIHLAISRAWKVHYFTADMAENGAHRAEEKRFLDDMPGALGSRALAALASIGATLGLDYAGMDFALAPDGSVILFEANATMIIVLPPADPKWDYRRPTIRAALNAAESLFLMAKPGIVLSKAGQINIASCDRSDAINGSYSVDGERSGHQRHHHQHPGDCPAPLAMVE